MDDGAWVATGGCEVDAGAGMATGGWGRAELSSASRLHAPSPVHTELAHLCAPHSVNHRVTFVIHASAQRRFIYRYELSDQTLVTWVNVN